MPDMATGGVDVETVILAEAVVKEDGPTLVEEVADTSFGEGVRRLRSGCSSGKDALSSSCLPPYV